MRSPDDPGVTELIRLRLPSARLGQLEALAARQGSTAATLVSDWVLSLIAEHDPEDTLLPVPEPGEPSTDRLASVSHLHRLDTPPRPRRSEPEPPPGEGATRPLPTRRRPRGSESHPAGIRLR